MWKRNLKVLGDMYKIWIKWYNIITQVVALFIGRKALTWAWPMDRPEPPTPKRWRCSQARSARKQSSCRGAKISATRSTSTSRATTRNWTRSKSKPSWGWMKCVDPHCSCVSRDWPRASTRRVSFTAPTGHPAPADYTPPNGWASLPTGRGSTFFKTWPL